MKKKLLLSLLCCLLSLVTKAQQQTATFTISPEKFSVDQEITITVSDIAPSQWNTSEVYLWAWYFKSDDKNLSNAINSPTNGDWTHSDEAQKFTANGDGTYSFTFTPKDLFRTSDIGSIGMLAKAKDGTGDKKTQDNVVKVGFSAPTPTEAAVPDGLHDGINTYPNDPSKISLVLYAPEKDYVHVIGNFNDWAVDNTYLMKKDSAKDKFWITLTGLNKANILFQYDIENSIKVADPYSSLILSPYDDADIPASSFANIPDYPNGKTTEAISWIRLNTPSYTWKTTNFQAPAKKDLMIYEILIRDFDDVQNFDAVKNKLDYLQNLGINAIELMPVAEFDGNLSWGYNTAFHDALDKFYGSPEMFKALIDECHSRGIAVIMDIVFNHATGQSPLFRMYNDSNGGLNGKPAADSPYFNVEAKHAYSVFNDFNHQSPATQAYVQQTLQHWIDNYHIDGFRWDLTKGFTQACSPSDEACTNAYQQDRVSVLEKYADMQWAENPDFYVIFEHLGLGGSRKEEKAFANYREDEGKGIMFWNKNTYTYNQATMGYNDSDFSDISYKNIGIKAPRNVGYMESHDEERLMFKNLAFGNADGSYNVKDLSTALNRMKAAGAFFFTVPGPKMIWQFGELGYDHSIFECADGTMPQPYGNDQCKLDEKPDGWEYLNNADRVSLHDAWKRMIALKENNPIFSTDNFTMDVVPDALKKIHLTDDMATGNQIQYVTIIGNFGVTTKSINPEFQVVGTWYNLMDGSTVSISNKNASISLAPGQFFIYGNKPGSLGGNHAEKTGFFIYPNPTNSAFAITQNAELLSIFTMQGKLVKNFHHVSKNKNYSIAELPAGLYLIQIKKNGKTSYSKLIVQ